MIRRAAVLSVSAVALMGAAPKPAPAGKPTAAEAKAFVAQAETDMDAMRRTVSPISWVQATYINIDTTTTAAKAGGEANAQAVKYAKAAHRFDHVSVDPVTRRKLSILSRGVNLPAPDRPGAAEELSAIGGRNQTLYSTGKFTWKGKVLNLEDMEDVLRSSRDPAETKAIWEGWRKISPPMAKDYAREVVLANEGSRALGYKDAGALWRSGYDMSPDAFATKVDALWGQVAPFYTKLHCYVRARLNAKYGDAVQPRTGPIRADLTGNMWGQEWGNIYDIVAPANGPGLGYDLDERLKAQNYDAVKLTKTGEGFYTSIGLQALPDTFWTRSQLSRPRDRDVVCHASAWTVQGPKDVRIKACLRTNADDFFTAHHELGHLYYDLAYADQSPLFRGGANDGFHEAIGDFAGLNSLTPDYLKRLGIIDSVPGADADIPYLLRRAMDSVAFLPFGLLVDKWRWEVFSGEATPENWNTKWWELVRHYQGMTPPGDRPADAFDPGAKQHIPGNTPYMRYFLARIYEFQFYRSACKQAGWTGPLNRCSVYGNKAVGAKFEKMLAMGQSQPWPDALEAFTGERDIDATAIADYFAPLDRWLTVQTKGERCGWQA